MTEDHRARETRPAVPPEPPAGGARPLAVLLVEDDEVNRSAQTELIRRLGHRVVAAANGLEALEALSLGEFDLVVTDILMPGMDGLELTRLIRSGSVPRCPPELPVIAITALAMVGDREAFLAHGVDDYLSKPFLLKDLARLLGNWHSRLRPGH